MTNKNGLGISEPYALMLAHGDDEIGARSGLGESDLSEKREREIMRSWRILYSDSEVINFGSDFEIPDGALHSSLTVAHLEILEKLLSYSGIKFIVTTHAEGGHQDHDTTFMVSQYLSLKLEVGLFSFPLYSQSSFSKKLFRVMISHGSGIKNEIKGMQIRVRSFVTAIQLIFNYRSQWKTWIGLSLPLMFAMIRKYQFLEPTYVSLNSYPESSILFYESRGRADRASVTSHWSKIGIISNKHF